MAADQQSNPRRRRGHSKRLQFASAERRTEQCLASPCADGDWPTDIGKMALPMMIVMAAVARRR
jgi:hypothetical protein